MEKKFNIVFGIHIDLKLRLLSLEASPKLALNQERKYFIWGLLQEPLFPMFQILLVQRVLYMQLSSPIESVEISSIWLKREPMLSQSSMTQENLWIIDSSLEW